MEELNEIKKQFNELMERAEKTVEGHKKDDEPKRWRAGQDEDYYYFDSDLSIHVTQDDHWGYDNWRYETGNYFQTGEEAEKVAQHFKDYLTLRADAKGYVPESDSVYYEVCYDYVIEELRTRRVVTCVGADLAFRMERDAIASIAEHKDVWLRYLRVKK